MSSDFRKSYKKRKASLMKQKEKMQRMNSSNYPSIIDSSKLPDGIEVMKKIEEGKHAFDIIPFIAGDNFPVDSDGRSKIVDEGDFAYSVPLFIHTNIGSQRRPIVCPQKNYGNPCPICEYIAENNLEQEIWKVISPKRRDLFFIWSRDSRKDEKKGIQVMEISTFSFGSQIDEIANNPRKGGAIPYWDIDDGKTILFTRKGSGQLNTRYLGFSFDSRDEPIPEEIIDQTFPLDEIIIVLSYDEIEKHFKGQIRELENLDDDDNNDENDEDTKPSRSAKNERKRRSRDDDDDGDDEDDEDTKPSRPTKSERKRSSRDEDEDDKPKRAKLTKTKRPSRSDEDSEYDVPDDDDDNDDEDDDTAPSRPKQGGGSSSSRWDDTDDEENDAGYDDDRPARRNSRRTGGR